MEQPITTIHLCGMPITRLNSGQLLDYLFAELAAGRGGWLLTANLDFLRRYVRDAAAHRIYSGADICVADGMPLVWASRLQGTPLPERVAGSSLVLPLCQRAARDGRSVYLLGGDPRASEAAASKLCAEIPGFSLAGRSSPWLSAATTDEELAPTGEELRAAHPDIVLVAFGSPKQEQVIAQLRDELPRAWWIGVGISLSFLAGHVRRAPRIAQRLGLEWAHRLVQEPRRLFRRYVVDDLPFAFELLGSSLLARRCRGNGSAEEPDHWAGRAERGKRAERRERAERGERAERAERAHVTDGPLARWKAPARLLLIVPFVALVALGPLAGDARPRPDVSAINQAMSPGINYGNILEADPIEGWGLQAREADFNIIARGGFKSVRMPIRWSAMTAASAPYAIDVAFAAKVKRIVDAALRSGLHVIINVHHYQGLFDRPHEQEDRFLAMWDQIAGAYRGYPRTLLFEILNEPHGKLTPQLWNVQLARALAVIRRSNRDRVVLIGTAAHGGTGALDQLILPRDENIILTFHHYTPFQFTHQGAMWVGARSLDWLGRRWRGSEAELAELRADFDKVRAYARRHGVAVNLGEYGVHSKADMESRVRWTAEMAKLARSYDYSHHYWEFKANAFGAYDEKAARWREGLRRAIVP